MPKLKGQIQRYAPQRTMSDMLTDMTNTLSNIGDKRFERFWNYKPIPPIMEWFKRSKRINVLVGATKSTKTTCGVFKAIMVYTGMVPPSMQDTWNHAPLITNLNRPRHVRIIVQDYTKHWPETIKPLLLSDEWGMLPEAWAQNYEEKEHMFYGPDGSFLSIMAIDPKQAVDPNILRGPIIDHAYIDELQQRMVYAESLSRNATLSDGPRTVDLGYCPQEGYDWTYEDLYLTGYDRQTDAPLSPDKCSQDINVLRVTMRDNPSISQEAQDSYIRTFKPWEVAYRVDGRYTAHAGDPYFDMYQLIDWKNTGKQKHGAPYVIEKKDVNPDEGEFEANMHDATGASPESENVWQVWEKQKNGHYYLLTMDTAEGHAKGNFSVADMWRCSEEVPITTSRTDGKKIEIKININKPIQVAQLRKRTIKPGDFALEGCMMATIYGECLMCYEVNNTCGGTVRDRSRNYTNLYHRAGPSKKEVEDITEYVGWWTDQYNKPTALEELYHMMQEWKVVNYCGINSPETLADMMSYEEHIERDEETGVSKRTFSPQSGCFDDCVSSAWQMAYILRFQNMMLTEALISVKSATEKYKSPIEEESERIQRRKTGNQLRKQPSLQSLSRGQHGGSTRH